MIKEEISKGLRSVLEKDFKKKKEGCDRYFNLLREFSGKKIQLNGQYRKWQAKYELLSEKKDALQKQFYGEAKDPCGSNRCDKCLYWKYSKVIGLKACDYFQNEKENGGLFKGFYPKKGD